MVTVASYVFSYYPYCGEGNPSPKCNLQVTKICNSICRGRGHGIICDSCSCYYANCEMTSVCHEYWECHCTDGHTWDEYCIAPDRVCPK